MPAMDTRWNHNIHYHPVVLGALPDPCDRVLDVGCGEGLLARELSGRAGHVTAIDLDAPILDLARAGESAANIDYVEGNFLTHPFDKESFDAVVSVATVHHMDLADALTRMSELVRPGGRVAIIGLARARSPLDLAYAAAGSIGTRLHKLTKTHWETSAPKIWPPPHTFNEARATAHKVLPTSQFRRQILFRYSLTWTKPR